MSVDRWMYHSDIGFNNVIFGYTIEIQRDKDFHITRFVNSMNTQRRIHQYECR